MFKRENRLLGGVKFSSSHSFSVPQFVLKERENDLELNRFGIVVPKKVDKRAVVRNKIKRMFRISLLDLNKNMAPGHDILFIARVGILNKTKEENHDIIKSSIEKAGLMKMRVES